MSDGESKFIERKSKAARFAAGKRSAAGGHLPDDLNAEQLKAVQGDCHKLVHALARRCGVEFRGRILEIGAGGAWLSAELSKLPRVVEIIATDFEADDLRDGAPRVFTWLKARAGKITRTIVEPQELDFPDRYFDFVICIGALRQGLNVAQLLRECARVLKPGGTLIAVREPVQPFPVAAKKGRAKADAESAVHSVAESEKLFQRTGFDVKVRDLKLAARWRYHYDRLVNGVLHARHAIVGTKASRR